MAGTMLAFARGVELVARRSSEQGKRPGSGSISAGHLKAARGLAAMSLRVPAACFFSAYGQALHQVPMSTSIVQVRTRERHAP